MGVPDLQKTEWPHGFSVSDGSGKTLSGTPKILALREPPRQLREFHASCPVQTADLQGNHGGIGHAEWNFMKPRCSPRRNHALTVPEFVIILFVLAILFALLLPVLNMSGKRRVSLNLTCERNLKEIDLAARIWEGNHGDQYPMAVSTTNGGAMEFAATGNAAIFFQVMSNELSTPKILLCPADADHSLATNFSTGFSVKNISYFINLNAIEANPEIALFGDDNFEIGGIPVNPGLLQVPANASITWSAARHHFAGNIVITDGSVQGLTSFDLQQALQNSEITTNRILIP